MAPQTRGGPGKHYSENVEKWVESGSTVYTDQFVGYRHLGQKFQHAYVTHRSEGSRVRIPPGANG